MVHRALVEPTMYYGPQLSRLIESRRARQSSLWTQSHKMVNLNNFWELNTPTKKFSEAEYVMLRQYGKGLPNSLPTSS